jgi:hypothetical protein
MEITQIVPESIIERLKTHIKEKSLQAEEGWDSAKEDEDSLTGDFFGQLRKKETYEDGWTIKIDYKKFRGRGNNAYEKKVGADGIITIEVENDSIKHVKSIIFQAKKRKNEDIKEQLSKMANILPEANMVIVYSDEGYYAETGEEYTNSNNLSMRAGDYIADIFVGCKKGKWGVEYDPHGKQIKMPESNLADIDLLHRLKIEISKD